jgi:hypothetical protein
MRAPLVQVAGMGASAARRGPGQSAGVPDALDSFLVMATVYGDVVVEFPVGTEGMAATPLGQRAALCWRSGYAGGIGSIRNRWSVASEHLPWTTSALLSVCGSRRPRHWSVTTGRMRTCAAAGSPTRSMRNCCGRSVDHSRAASLIRREMLLPIESGYLDETMLRRGAGLPWTRRTSVDGCARSVRFEE